MEDTSRDEVRDLKSEVKRLKEEVRFMHFCIREAEVQVVGLYKGVQLCMWDPLRMEFSKGEMVGVGRALEVVEDLARMVQA